MSNAVSLCGIVNVNVAPPAELLYPRIVPLCALIIDFDMNKPSPVPLRDFDTNFVNILGSISFRIPEPVSETVTIILSV
jgi:hypothetical protein